MKKLIIALLFLPFIARSQISFQMRLGYATKTVEPIVCSGVEFVYNGFAMTPEMIIHYRNTQPVDFGMKVSYQYSFIQIGYGRYFDLFTTDKGYSNLNGFSNLFFIAGHWKQYFIEYDYLRQSIITIGAKATIFNNQ